MKVRPFTIGRSLKQVNWIRQQRHIKAKELLVPRHLLVFCLRNGIPAFIRVKVAGVAVVRPVANAPTVVWHQNRCVAEVPNQAVEPFLPRKRTVTTIMPDDKERPKHGALHQPENRKKPPRVDRVGDRIKRSDNPKI